MRRFTSLEICSGAGGQALGLERAGFDPVMLFDRDPHACETLRLNRPQWDVRELDLFEFVGADHPQVLDVDLLAGGLPRGQYSTAGKGRVVTSESRDPLRAALWLTAEVRPRALMLENVPGLVTKAAFADVRRYVEDELKGLGYEYAWKVLDAQGHGVPQRREHGVLVAMREFDDMDRFDWPEPSGTAPTVGAVLGPSMGVRGWPQAVEWSRRAAEVAPSIVGGSADRGGADLGPSRSKDIWARLGVNGGSIGDEVPGPDFVMSEDPEDRKGLPKLTVPQVALLQGFPPDWRLAGRKTSRYRQIGHAFPPPLAEALGRRIAEALAR